MQNSNQRCHSSNINIQHSFLGLHTENIEVMERKHCSLPADAISFSHFLYLFAATLYKD